MNRLYKNGMIILGVLFLGYHSVYFEKLSARDDAEDSSFDFQAFADSLYYNGITKSEHAVELSHLIKEVQNNTEQTFEDHGNRLGIGTSAFFMTQCEGSISEIAEDYLLIEVDDSLEVAINTRYIFGNALRDASQLVALTDFKTNADFNKVSESLNALIRQKVLPPIVENLAVGDVVDVMGAIKLSRKNLRDPSLIITPATINVR